MIISFVVDNKEVSCQKGYTILKALSYVNIDIPHLCNYGFSNINNINYLNENNNLSHIKSEWDLNCKLCIVKVKKKTEDEYKYTYACNEIIESGMDIISSDEELIEYRKAILTSIDYTHKPYCCSCDIYYKCNLKKYLDLYKIEKKEDLSKEEQNIIKTNRDIEHIKKLVETFKLPSYIKVDFDRCIVCGICDKYKTSSGYYSAIVDLCPTKVFTVERNIDRKSSEYESIDYDEVSKKADYLKAQVEKETLKPVVEEEEEKDNFIKREIVNYNTTKSICLGCNELCDVNYIHQDDAIIDMVSCSDKKYSICDFGRKMSFHSNYIFEYPLVNGVEQDLELAKSYYFKFIEDIDTNSYLAISSTIYPLEDLKSFNSLATSLGIDRIMYKKIPAATRFQVVRDNYTNINNYVISEFKKELKDINEFVGNYSSFNKFIILGDAFDECEEVIEFSRKYKRQYIVFTSCKSILAYNAHIAFPISGLGEFDGIYIDKFGRKKKMSNFIKKNKNRKSLREFLEILS